MPRQEDKREIEELHRMNEKLTRSLKLCHSIVDDYRSKLLADSNDIDSADKDAPVGSDPR